MDGWEMKVIPSIKNHSLGFYFGFYSPEISSNGYLLSVVAVGAGNISHIVVWKDSYFVPENSTLELSGAGLTLRDPLRSLDWQGYPYSVVGMKLTEEGNFVLFGRRRRGYTRFKCLHTTRHPSTAGLTEGANFSVYTNPSDGGHLIYSQLQLEGNSSDIWTKISTSERSHPLELIVCVKLDEDGRLLTYQLNSKEIGINVVDMITSKCETMKDQYQLAEVRDENVSWTQANPIKHRKSIKFIRVLLSAIGESNLIPPSPSPSREDTPDALPPIPSLSPLPPGENTAKALPPTLPSSRHRKRLAAMISASTAGGLIVIILIILVSLVMLRKSGLEKNENHLKQVPGLLLRFSYEDLEIATGNFKEILGRGGFWICV
ncbi:Concanavalin A-like lectin/glucanase domain containing protein [Trema orientale]|uniref:Concanavalin A-like lectin/glucanase domain containing protein n=1 Tax=Trema orientale TaxID=63057 RepID=A0A2P5FFC1_TREOI|nr:Concanavalin A-like lectin/glucanase domain containing protein [Trema orientale]